MTDIYEEIKELKKKATLYDNRNERTEEAISKIKKSLDDIKDALNDLSPFSIQLRGRRNNNTEIYVELMQKMIEGTHITAKLIRATYPNANSNAILKCLEKKPEVNKVKDGNLTRLFITRSP